MTVDRALLKVNQDIDYTIESVSVNQHTYKVEGPYLLVDVRPFLEAPRMIENPDPASTEKYIQNPLYDGNADAEVDARELCRITHTVDEFGVQRRYRLFDPPTKADRERWLSDPANKDLWEGIVAVDPAVPNTANKKTSNKKPESESDSSKSDS